MNRQRLRWRSFLSAALLLTAFLTSCRTTGSSGTSPVGGDTPTGSLVIAVVPNPIRAAKVSGTTYDFAFELIVREIGGANVKITSVSFDLLAAGAFRVHSESFDRAEIARRGFATTVESRGELRYRFNFRREVPDERLFSSVSGELTVSGVDSQGREITAKERVTVNN